MELLHTDMDGLPALLLARLQAGAQRITPDEAMIEGLDVSHWQSSINWQKMKSAGVKFIYLKCSEGTYYKDDTFANNYKNARAQGIKVGAYHFLTAERALAQYYWFISCMGGRVFELVPAMDVETHGISQALVDDLGKFLVQHMAANPVLFPMEYKHPAIYTNQSFANTLFTAERDGALSALVGDARA